MRLDFWANSCKFNKQAGGLKMRYFLALLIVSILPMMSLAGEKLTHVESKKVCMVNNNFMGKDQIPVQVSNKTYYGCCEMCKGTLKSSAEHRSAIDPISKKTVDKAKAYIGMKSDGSVVYFENKKNFKKFNSKN